MSAAPAITSDLVPAYTDAHGVSCAFCHGWGHSIESCTSPYIVRLCEETREHARNSYLYKNENVLLNHLRTYSFDILKILYLNWVNTAPFDVRECIRNIPSTFPESSSILSYLIINYLLNLLNLKLRKKV